MTHSLKRRMLSAMVSWIVLAWCASLLAVYTYTTYSQTSIWDERLQMIGVKLLQLSPPMPATRADSSAVRAELTFQIWDRDGHLLTSTPGAPDRPLRADFVDGFASVDIGGETWRVFSISNREGVRVQVGNPRAMINADFQKHALRSVSLAALPLALGGLLLWWSVQVALRPIARIEATARVRSPFDLTPLPGEALPMELQPLVHSFNQLLTRVDQSLQAERRFIGDAAHELRTPLSALQAQLDVAMRAPSTQEKDAALVKLQAAVRRSVRLSEQLLDLARLDAGTRAPVREWQALDDIVRHVASEFDVGARLQQRTIVLELDACQLRCDMDEIGILVRNLLDNALRYTLPGATVRIRCGSLEDGHVFIEVADDGPGVPASERQAIYERFHRASANSSVRGAGIGLSLVARIASAHQAPIDTTDGIDGRGLSVRVTFPLLKNS